MEAKDNSEASSAAQSGLLAINNLSYTFGRDLSVAVSRTNTTQHFASQTYAPGDTAVSCLFFFFAYNFFFRSASSIREQVLLIQDGVILKSKSKTNQEETSGSDRLLL